jgi:hypothetical protein
MRGHGGLRRQILAQRLRGGHHQQGLRHVESPGPAAASGANRTAARRAPTLREAEGPTGPEVADAFRRYGDGYRERHARRCPRRSVAS